MKQIKFICAAMLLFTTAASAQEITSFTATYSNAALNKIASSTTIQEAHKVQLNWNILSEKNVQRFEIERSQDNEHYRKLHSISKPFSSNEREQFSYTDIISNPGTCIYYYRLKVVSKGREVKMTPAHVVRIKRPVISEEILSQNSKVKTQKLSSL